VMTRGGEKHQREEGTVLGREIKKISGCICT
jgi:hypothetical protein